MILSHGELASHTACSDSADVQMRTAGAEQRDGSRASQNRQLTHSLRSFEGLDISRVPSSESRIGDALHDGLMPDGRLSAASHVAEHLDGSMRDGRHFPRSSADRAMLKRLGDGENRDGSLSDVRRGGSGSANEPSALERALMGRFDSKSPTVGSAVVLNTIQTTSLLIPHALQLPPTPPSGVNTHPTRPDAACSIDISHETPPTSSLTPSFTSATSVKA